VSESRPETWTYPGSSSEGKWSRSYRLLGIAAGLLWRTGAMRAVAAVSLVAWSCSWIALFGPVLSRYAEHHSRLELMVGSAVVAYPFLLVTVFCSVAILAAASACMDGRRLTVRESFGVAARRLPQIAGWCALAVGVGTLLNAIAQWVPWGGRLLSWALGVAWSLATLFAVPIIALEGKGGRAAARASAKVFRERWGESGIGVLSITACTAIVTVPGCMLLGAGVATSGPTGLVLLTIGLTLVALGGFAATVTEQLFALTLYRYAREGQVHGGFTLDDLRQGMPIKSRRRGLFGRRRD
jgi:Family of unknown function (DUF6159)